MGKWRMHIEGSFDFKYADKDYTTEFSGVVERIHEEGCMYRSDGDPGDPPYDEATVEELDFVVREITDDAEVLVEEKTYPGLYKYAKEFIVDTTEKDPDYFSIEA